LRRIAENEFPGQIGIRQSRSGDNPVYHYHQNTLRFSHGIVKLAEGESTWFKYTYFSSSGEVLIQFQAVVPKTIQAAKMLEKWLRKMTDPEAQKNQVSASGLARPVRSETDDCHQFDPGEQCQTGDFESGFELCETPICGGGSDDEPDDEWPPPPPDDPDWTDPDECDDPTGFDCDDGTGGSSGDGGGSGDDCDPGAIDQPAGCEESYMEMPLMTEDDFLSDNTIPDCNEEQTEPWKIDYCASQEPTGTRLNRTNIALDNIGQRGSECLNIAERGMELLQEGNLKYFPRPDRSFNVVGGWGFDKLEGGFVLLMDEWVDSWFDNTGIVMDTDGSEITVNFEFVLVHEIEHSLGRGHVGNSRWITQNANQCSALN